MSRFRDIQSEIDQIITEINLRMDDVLIEFGSGTSELSIYAAQLCKKVIAVDISNEMIEYSKIKAESRGIKNIEFINAGYLSYRHSIENVDKIVSQLALHHIPDFWKQIALCNLSKILKPNGIFYLADVIFSFNPLDYKNEFDKVYLEFKENANDELSSEWIHHINQEYSTFSWVIEKMLEKANFRLIKKIEKTKVYMVYISQKI